MNNNLTELVFILDRSGSMRGLESDTIGGYNSLLEKQKNEAGDAVVTTVLFDDQYEIEAAMRVYGDTSDEECIVKLPEDEYYGSDFLLAAEALNFTMPDNWNHSNCFYCMEAPDLNTEKDNPGTSFTDTMEDGLSWAEGALCNDALKHICICFPIHDICCHNPYSIPDLLRINDVKIEVKLSIEHHMTQHGIRSFEPGYRTLR